MRIFNDAEDVSEGILDGRDFDSLANVLDFLVNGGAQFDNPLECGFGVFHTQ